MLIIITGSPGTGKTTVAKQLGKQLNLPVTSEKTIITKERIATKDKDELVVSIPKLQKAAKKYTKNSTVLEGHLLCETNLKPDFIIVLRTHPTTLKQRLKKRKYSQSKIDDNVDAEILDYCKIMVAEHSPKTKTFEVDTTHKTPKQASDLIIRVIDGKNQPDTVDWSEEYVKSQKVL